MMKKGALAAALALTFSLTLTACGGNPGGGNGGDNNGGGNNGGGNNGGTGNAALRTKFAACPIANMSSDPAASTCLAGTYNMSTLDGKTCTLTVRADSTYDFTSPNLTYSYTPKSNGFRVFNHINPQGDNHQVLWSINDPLSADTVYELDFEARFGSLLGANDQYLEIKAKRIASGGAETNVTCKTTL